MPFKGRHQGEPKGSAKGKRRLGGTICVFAALCLPLAAAVLLTLLEAARLNLGRKEAKSVTQSVLESQFAAYDSAGWEYYHLLMRPLSAASGHIDLADVEESMKGLAKEALNPSESGSSFGRDFLRADVQSMAVTGYTLLTDEDGAIFSACAAASAKRDTDEEEIKDRQSLWIEEAERAPYDVAGVLEMALSLVRSSGAGRAGEGGFADAQAADAADAAKEAAEAAKGAGSEDAAEPDLVSSVNARLQEAAAGQEREQMLFLLPDGFSLSALEMDLPKTISHRTLLKGKSDLSAASIDADFDDDFDDDQQALLVCYVRLHFGDALEPKTGGALRYEKEYLIGGAGSDEENLLLCLQQILFLREAENYQKLSEDEQLMREAKEEAASYLGGTADTAAFSALFEGLLAARAYEQSEKDLRVLLLGGQVESTRPLSGQVDRLSYGDYLDLLLYGQEEPLLCCRAMDLCERYLQNLDGYDDFALDRAAVGMSVCASVCFHENFLSLVSLADFGGSRFTISSFCSFSYLPSAAQPQ